MKPPLTVDRLRALSRDHIEIAFVANWWAGDMLILRMADLARAFARVDQPAAVSFVEELRRWVRRDVAALRAGHPHLDGALRSVETRVMEGLDDVAKAAAEPATPGHETANERGARRHVPPRVRSRARVMLAALDPSSPEPPMTSRTVFTDADIAAWSAALDSRRPAAIAEQEWPSLPQVDAFSPLALSGGMAFRLATRDRGLISFTINAVAARHMAACILAMGQQAGWLDADGALTKPPFTYDA